MPCSLCRNIGHNRLTCAIRNSQSQNYENKILKNQKNKTNNCLQRGVAYEQTILNKLSTLSYCGQPIQHLQETAGASLNPDIQLCIGSNIINLEVKSKGAFEGGGKGMKLNNNKLTCPFGTIHDVMLGSYVPWSGQIPSFLQGDKSLTTWNREKFIFRDQYLRIAPETISRYYRSMVIQYIQIQDKGLYHTGEDVLHLNVPFFQCRARLRIRCKQHTSSPMPSSVQASFTFDRRSLEDSVYDIENKLPTLFESNL